jgi:hypothetical protein
VLKPLVHLPQVEDAIQLAVKAAEDVLHELQLVQRINGKGRHYVRTSSAGDLRQSVLLPHTKREHSLKILEIKDVSLSTIKTPQKHDSNATTAVVKKKKKKKPQK